ncbi:sulfite exporter TauE/SafE family protein [Pseudooceanicola sp.]|uniref:sulfite exporter TauE/SafE family protein n=1 Tax=Pseudooceanicola sp. TaxID=1914328 RepID=UPI0035C6EB7D
MFTTLVLILAGLLAGALNAVAGGGTFLSFPALVWAGVPPVMANATATLAALPGYLSSTWAFRDDIRASQSLPIFVVVSVSAIGGALGAVLLLVTPGEVFEGVVPWLLAFATVIFAMGPRITALLQRYGRGKSGLVTAALILLLVTSYGGYFNGGVGILLLAAFGLIGLSNLNEMNGLKTLVASVLSVVSVVVYIGAGLIAWQHAIVLGLACATGGYLGAALSRRIARPVLLRLFITAVGAVMTLIFFVR